MASLADLQSYATDEANAYGIPPQLFLWQIGQESGWNPNAQNGNATGIAQFMPATAAQYGVNPSDPFSSIAGAAALDSNLYAKTGNWTDALTQYGTLANVPQSVMDSYNSLMASLGLPAEGSSGSGSPPNSNSTSSTPSPFAGFASFTPTSILGRIGFFLLGLIFLFGAIYVYRR